MLHTPVLKEEVVRHLNPKPNQKFIDATLGFAGHSKAILEAIEKQGGKGKVLGLERDNQVCQLIRKEKILGLEIVNGSFGFLKDLSIANGFNKVNGILFDLGFNSWHIEHSGRGFTFQKNEPLDMRYSSKETALTANAIINGYSEKDLVKLLKKYSQEKFAKKIVRAIIVQRQIKPIQTTFELIEVIRQAASETSAFKRLKNKIHPATRTFQALRIEVNQELPILKEGLKQAIEVLAPEGKLALISFHSLEERIIKNFFKEQARNKILKIITKSPILPKKTEINLNPRARSAKLWVAEKR